MERCLSIAKFRLRRREAALKAVSESATTTWSGDKVPPARPWLLSDLWFVDQDTSCDADGTLASNRLIMGPSGARMAATLPCA